MKFGEFLIGQYMRKGIFLCNFKSLEEAISQSSFAFPYFTLDHEIFKHPDFPKQHDDVIQACDRTKDFVILLCIFSRGFSVPIIVNKDACDSVTWEDIVLGGRGMYTPKGKETEYQCFACKSKGVELLRCTGCNVARYCNKKCQKKDWKNHIAGCKKLRQEIANS